MRPAIDFMLHEVLPSGQVTGRCCGADVMLGTVFTGLYRRTFSASWLADESVPDPVPAFVCGLSLQVTGIEMWQRPMEFATGSHTALLGLSGEGLDAASQLLFAAPARTYYSLCADLPSTRTA